MPSKSFFDWRSALPGYVFILIIIGINYSPLLEILAAHEAQSIFGAILAFLTLLSGTSIGILVSQFWWNFYQLKGAQYFY
jgi:hypothetical protein